MGDIDEAILRLRNLQQFLRDNAYRYGGQRMNDDLADADAIDIVLNYILANG